MTKKTLFIPLIVFVMVVFSISTAISDVSNISDGENSNDGDTAYTAQRIHIAYLSSNAANGYWTGLAIHNPTSSPITVNLYAYDAATGNLVGIADAWCWTIPGRGTLTKLLQGFYRTSTITGKLNLSIVTENAMSTQMSATVFMGNNGESNPGFAFNTYYSEDFTSSVTRCVY